MLKKILSVMVSAFCLSFAINFFDESKVHAERVWAFSLGNVNFYVDIDHSYWWAAVVSNDGRGDYGYPCEFQFVYNGMDRLSCNIYYNNGTRVFVLPEESRMAQVVLIRSLRKTTRQADQAKSSLETRSNK